MSILLALSALAGVAGLVFVITGAWMMGSAQAAPVMGMPLAMAILLGLFLITAGGLAAYACWQKLTGPKKTAPDQAPSSRS